MSETATSTQETARIEVGGQTIELPVHEGTENEKAIDISTLRAKTGYITLDSGFGNTGSCKSDITFIDGEAGILRYRGYPIEQLAGTSTFVETAYLVIFGELPTRSQLSEFSRLLTENELIHEGLRHNFEGFPPDAHPMAILSSMINAMSCYHPQLLKIESDEAFEQASARLLSKVRTIAAFSYRKASGFPIVYPYPEYGYCENFLHMMFSLPHKEFEIKPALAKALNLILVLHADHEQNCSTSTVRMVGSSGANLFASCSAGVCALWGPLHGGANMAVIKMLDHIKKSDLTLEQYVEKAKDKDSGIRLMGFGHRVYKNFDPRAKIIKKACDEVLDTLGIKEEELDIAKRLEEIALSDDYFIERNLYPNVDFYSGIIMKAMGIPLNMFTVMFAIGRMPGWIANWREVAQDPNGRIYRPRQIYTGATERNYVPIDNR
jgi:citrate synthase